MRSRTPPISISFLPDPPSLIPYPESTRVITSYSIHYTKLYERIPTLHEVVTLIKGKAGVNIELKGPGTAEPVEKFIRECVEAGWDKRTFLASSFDHQELFNLRALDPDIQLGVICRFATTAELDLTRITSYNVCYTKLLRMRDDSGPDRR